MAATSAWDSRKKPKIIFGKGNALVRAHGVFLKIGWGLFEDRMGFFLRSGGVYLKIAWVFFEARMVFS